MDYYLIIVVRKVNPLPIESDGQLGLGFSTAGTLFGLDGNIHNHS